MVWENGAKYSGEWNNDKMDGLGKYTFSDGKTPKEHIGRFKDGLPNGEGLLTYKNGDIYDGDFKDGKRHGKGTMTYPDGSKYVGDWKE